MPSSDEGPTGGSPGGWGDLMQDGLNARGVEDFIAHEVASKEAALRGSQSAAALLSRPRPSVAESLRRASPELKRRTAVATEAIHKWNPSAHRARGVRQSPSRSLRTRRHYQAQLEGIEASSNDGSRLDEEEDSIVEPSSMRAEPPHKPRSPLRSPLRSPQDSRKSKLWKRS